MAFVIAPGNSLMMPTPPSSIDHPWIFLTHLAGEPPMRVAMVNLTSVRSGCDRTTVFKKGDHPWIVKDTYVYYKDARLTEGAKILAASKWYPAMDFSSIVAKIQADIYKSPHTPPEVLEFCRKHI